MGTCRGGQLCSAVFCHWCSGGGGLLSTPCSMPAMVCACRHGLHEHALISLCLPLEPALQEHAVFDTVCLATAVHRLANLRGAPNMHAQIVQAPEFYRLKQLIRESSLPCLSTGLAAWRHGHGPTYGPTQRQALARPCLVNLLFAFFTPCLLLPPKPCLQSSAGGSSRRATSATRCGRWPRSTTTPATSSCRWAIPAVDGNVLH